MSSKYFKNLSTFITSSVDTQLYVIITFHLDNFSNLLCGLFVLSSLTLLNTGVIVSLDSECKIIPLFCSLPPNGFPACHHYKVTLGPHHLAISSIPQYFSYTSLCTLSWPFQAYSHFRAFPPVSSALMTSPHVFMSYYLTSSGVCYNVTV